MRTLIGLLSAVLINLIHQAPPVNKHVVPAVSTPRVTVVEKTPTPQPVVEQPEPVAETPPPIQQTIPTTHEGLMEAAGISPSDYTYVDYIVTHESTWNLYAQEPNSGAYGLCQSLPAYKMASAGSDWQDNPVTQLRWCDSYAQSAYGGWGGAYYHWINYRWW